MKSSLLAAAALLVACGVRPSKGAPGGTTGGAAAARSTAKTLEFPAIAALIKSSLPPSFGGGLARDTPAAAGNIASDIASRFFSAGPTAVLSIATGLDGVTASMDSALGQTPTPTCATSAQAAVSYSMTLLGTSTSFVGQCYTQDGSGDLNQIGVDANGVHYLYQTAAVGRQAVVATPLSAGATNYSIEAWLTVGENNASGCPNAGGADDNWDTCSYTVMHLLTNTQTHLTEFAVAGLGVGFCGAQLMTDGSSAWVIGSEDGPGCGAVASDCVWVGSGSGTADCTALQSFQLTPIGRQGGVAHSSQAVAMTGGGPGQDWAASQYPAAPNVLLDGTSDDALHFGSASPAAGVGNLAQ